MGYKEIFDEHQTQYEKSNRIKFKAFLDIFKEETGLNIDHLADVHQIDMTDPVNEFYFMKWVLFNYSQKHIPYFYQLLEEMGYNLFSEVIEAMKTIGKETQDEVDPGVVEYVKISPYIDGITEHKDAPGLVTIHSEDLGDYSFYPSRVYLKGNKPALKLVNEFKTERFCHQMSWELVNCFDKCQLITSLLPSYFEGTHYHTIVKDDKGLIVDVANEAVYTEDTCDILFKPKDICVTEKADLDSRLEIATLEEDDESKKIGLPNAMLLTLHEQSKG